MLTGLQKQLEDLRQPYTSLNDPRTAATMADGSLSGLLKAIAGDVPAVQKVKLEQATQGATDLSGMVKRKKPAAAASAPTTTTTTTITGADASQTNGNGKRKAEDELGGDGADGVDGKRARLEEE